MGTLVVKGLNSIPYINYLKYSRLNTQYIKISSFFLQLNYSNKLCSCFWCKYFLRPRYLKTRYWLWRKYSLKKLAEFVFTTLTLIRKNRFRKITVNRLIRKSYFRNFSLNDSIVKSKSALISLHILHLLTTRKLTLHSFEFS